MSSSADNFFRLAGSLLRGFLGSSLLGSFGAVVYFSYTRQADQAVGLGLTITVLAFLELSARVLLIHPEPDCGTEPLRSPSGPSGTDSTEAVDEIRGCDPGCVCNSLPPCYEDDDQDTIQ